MKRHETVEQTAEHADLSSDTYRLLATGRIEATQPANGHDADADTDIAPHNGADIPHGSVYLPRFRFGSLRRRRTAPLLAA